MPDKTPPDEEQVTATLLKIPTLQLRRVFYEGLKNPLWVAPLARAGAFQSPPEPEAGRDGLVRDFIWPEIVYLTNMAPFVPHDVVDVVLSLEASTNAWVRRAVFRIGARVPAPEGKRLIPMLRSWKSADGFGWRTDPRHMVSFAVKLLEEGATKEGRWLANELFAPKPQGEGYARKPVTGLEGYWFETELPRIIEALGDDVFKAVTGWLSGWIDALPWYQQHDSSAAERSVISVLSEGEHHDPKHALIDAVRDQGARALTTDPSGTIQFLLRSDRQLFRKIALWLAANALSRPAADSTHTDALVVVAKDLLADPAHHDENMRVEYAELAQAVVSLDPRATEVVQAFVESGYADDLDWMRDGLPRDGKTDAEFETHVRERADRSKHRWLAAIGSQALPPQLAAKLRELDECWGGIDEPLEHPGKITSWTGPNAFSDRDEMSRMTPIELVEHLASWHATGDGWGPEPSHEGQGRELSDVIATKPLAVSGVPRLMTVLRPTYVRALLQGWGAALKSGLDLDWSQVAEVLEGTLTHSDESEFPREGRDFDDDVDFRAAKATGIGLLEHLLRQRDDVTMPEAAVDRFARLLLEHGADDGARKEYETYQHDTDSWAPLNISLNWRWPKHVRALLMLATRVGDNLHHAEALDRLDAELCHPDSHGAVWAVVGEYTGRLAKTCPEWLDLHFERFFGSAGGLTLQQQVATTTAISTHYYGPGLYQLLRGPMMAVLAFGDELKAGWGKPEEAQAKIGEWVIDSLIYGNTTMDDPLADVFFKQSSALLRGMALSNIAWSFFKSEEVHEDLRERFAALWDERFAHVREHPEDAVELNGFFWLAKSTVYKSAWWLPRLRSALEFEPAIASERYMIGRELAQASTDNPVDSLAVLKLLLKDSQGSMRGYDLSRYAVPVVIANALQAEDSALAQDARAYMNTLGAEGYLELEGEVQLVLAGKVTPDDVDE